MESPWGSNFTQTLVQVADSVNMQKLVSYITNFSFDHFCRQLSSPCIHKLKFSFYQLQLYYSSVVTMACVL